MQQRCVGCLYIQDLTELSQLHGRCCWGSQEETEAKSVKNLSEITQLVSGEARLRLSKSHLRTGGHSEWERWKGELPLLILMVGNGGEQNVFQMLKSPGEREENKFWYTTDNRYNDWRNMVQMDSMNFRGKNKGTGLDIIS